MNLGLKDIAILLLEHGADVNARCREGHSVLYYAASSRQKLADIDDELYVELLKLLLDHGAELDSSPERNSVFDSVLIFGTAGGLRLLVDRGVDLAASVPREPNGVLSPLHKATLNRDPGVLKYLIDSQHFDLDYQYNNHMTSLNFAAFFNNIGAVKTLAKRGADVDHRNEHGHTPLYGAALGGHTKVVRTLLSHGANVNLRTKYHSSILETIDLSQDLGEVGMLLLRHLAKLEALDRPISDRDYKLIRDFAELQDYFEECRAELAHMGESVIHGRVSFFDVLTAPDIGAYARNKHVADAFARQDDIQGDFPVYHDLLTERFDKELKKQRLVEKAVRGVSYLLRLDAETFRDIIYNVCRYLGNKDLRNLEGVGDESA